MKISFEVRNLPPKKDGANSMWRKSSELDHLKDLRKAAVTAMQGKPLAKSPVQLTIRVYAAPAKGDLDNFITGICDGLMAVHNLTPIDSTLWLDVPEPAMPHIPICFSDDALIYHISAERLPMDSLGEHYTVELEW